MKSIKYYIGIDVGKYGGVALINNSGKVLSLFEYDDKMFADLLYEYRYEYIDVWVEQQWPRPGSASMATFNLGKNYGRIIGILNANNRNINYVPPNKWKADIGVTSDKQTSIDKAHELFPGVDLRKSERCTKDHDGIAEALLIAEFGRNHRNS